jgi:hypothetical protein
MWILNQYTEGDMLVTEYTRDGETIAAVVRTAILDELENEVIELPKNPFLELQEENKALRDRLALAEAAIDDIIFGGGL